jgi:hypothetical protein
MATKMNDNLITSIRRVRKITERDYCHGIGLSQLILSGIEELGEYARAVLVSRGFKKRADLTEDSEAELLDLGICGIAMFWAAGGTEEMFLDKWGKNLYVPDMNLDAYVKREPGYLLVKLGRIQSEINELPYFSVINRNCSQVVLDLISELCYICTYGFGRERYSQQEIADGINAKLDKWEATQKGLDVNV